MKSWLRGPNSRLSSNPLFESTSNIDNLGYKSSSSISTSSNPEEEELFDSIGEQSYMEGEMENQQ